MHFKYFSPIFVFASALRRL